MSPGHRSSTISLSTSMAAVAASFLTGTCAIAFAQQEAARPQRPAPEAMQVAVALDNILNTWEQKSAIIESLQGEHDRYVYQRSVGLEIRAKGQYYFETPDKGRIDIEPVNVPEGAVNKQRLSADGNPLRIKSTDPETWVCNGTEVIGMHEALGQKFFTRVQIPPHMQGENVADGPLPFLFGVSAEKMKARYRLQIGPQHTWNPTDGSGDVHIIALPTRKSDAQNWQRAEVLLEGKYFLPKAIRLRHGVGPTADETVYVFDLNKIAANQKWRAQGMRALLPGFDPFEPNLRGYKLLEDHKIRQASDQAPPK